MNQQEFDALVVGDIVIRHTNGKHYIVSGTNRGITPGANEVWAKTIGPNGAGRGRIYTVTLDRFGVVGRFRCHNTVHDATMVCGLPTDHPSGVCDICRRALIGAAPGVGAR